MAKNKANKSKSNYDKQYLPYNQNRKEHIVLFLTKEEFNKLNNTNDDRIRYMVAIKKSTTTPPEPHKPPAWFSYWVENEFRPLKNDVVELKQEIANVRAELKQDISNLSLRLDNIVKKNNLKE